MKSSCSTAIAAIMLMSTAHAQAPALGAGANQSSPFPSASAIGAVSKLISKKGWARPLNQGDSAKREGSITGRLLNELGQPIPGAGISVRKIGASANTSRAIGTDEEGRFRAESLGPGSYLVSAYVPGYVPVIDSADRQYYRPGDMVVLRMTKGGAISGTVSNSAGEPIIGVRVSVVRVRDGERRPLRRAEQAGGSRVTDDRGVYRIYGLQSGTYLVVVNGGGATYYSSTGSAFEGDVPTYYLSTTRDAATEVQVRTGDDIGGIDIRYRGERGHIVSGTVSGTLGPDSGQRFSWVSLTHPGSGAIESSTSVFSRTGERGFALYGVPDGEYELVAQTALEAEINAASPPRHVTVKGSDVTGLDLALVPLGSISGRVVLESLSESERKGDCKDKRGASLQDVVLVGSADEKAAVRQQGPSGVFIPTDGTPDKNGNFKIPSLIAGRYRIETRLPTEDWFVRAITIPGSAKQQKDITNGLALNSSQNTANITVTLAEGAAGIRGKVTGAKESSIVSSRLRVHMVPAEVELAAAVLRYAEAKVDNDGTFSISNLAPGRYFVLVRQVSDEEFMDRDPRPLAWEPLSRTKLRSQAEAANTIIELQRCHSISDYTLKYSAPAPRKRGPGTRP
ncbi:MAG: carboxypeptidase-like regulatory domain-containing protein [Blastocatellia bacterium]